MALSLCVIWPLPVAAQARDSVHAIEGLVVGGRRVGAAGGASGVLVHPDSLLLRPGATVEDALRELPFVHVRQNSRGVAEISVRGSESRQVAVLLDGVPLSLAWDHRADPSVVPLLGARGISLVRGLPSVLGGPNVLGGVVEVDVGRGAGHQENDVRASAGWDDAGYRAAAASATRGAGRWVARAGAGFRAREGLALPRGVRDSAGHDGRRANSDVDEANAFGAVRWEGARGWASLSGSGFRAERGVPPELHLDEPRLWRIPQEWQGVAALSAGSGRRRTGWGAGEMEASLGLNAGRQEIESFSSTAYQEVVGRETGDGRTGTLRVLGRHTLGARGELRGAATYADVRHLETLDTAASAYRQRLWSVGDEAEWRFAAAARVTAGAALDGADTPRTGGKPALGALAAWGGRAGVSTLVRPDVQLHASLSSRARFPALRELYSGALGRFEPNPGLRPERLNAAEAGATWQRAGAQAQATFFAHRLDDAVVRISTPGRKFRRVNRDGLNSAGAELLLGGTVGGVRLLGDLVLQHVSREGGDSSRPEHMPSLRAGVDVDAPLPLALRGRVGVQHTGAQSCVHPELGTDVRLRPATRVDLGVRRGWRFLRATLALDNALDAAVFDQCGMPQPGRTFRVALELL